MIGENFICAEYSVFVGYVSHVRYLWMVRSSQNIRLFAEIDEAEDIIGQRTTCVDGKFYLIKSK